MPDYPAIVCVRVVMRNAPNGEQGRQRAFTHIANLLQLGLHAQGLDPDDIQVLSSQLIGPPERP